jgi:hypothetical protein
MVKNTNKNANLFILSHVNHIIIKYNEIIKLSKINDTLFIYKFFLVVFYLKIIIKIYYFYLIILILIMVLLIILF